jgi:iron complex outermembrane receptor protein
MRALAGLACAALWLGALTAHAQAGADAGAGAEADAEADADTDADAEPEAVSFSAVAVAPTPGARTAEWRVPRNVRLLGDDDLAEAGTLHGALQQRLAGVTVNDVQNNPLQPDLQYRGFTASPVLGSPQGLAVYQNGVRINEAFGDLMLWDLVPTFAIDRVQLEPGSNPLYGLNALGGSLVLEMKNGFRNPGYSAEMQAGSFGRFDTHADYGAAMEDVAAYAGASLFGESGFRQHSPSRALNLFGDIRQRGRRHELGVNVSFASTELYGNGPTPVQLLEVDRSALYTFPDITDNTLVMIAGDASRDLSHSLTLQGTTYVRMLSSDTLNGDEAEFMACAGAGDGAGESGATPATLCDEEGAPVVDFDGDPVNNAGDADGLMNTSATGTLGYGAAVQLVSSAALGSHANHFLLGSSYDGSRVDFVQGAELAELNDERLVEAIGPALGGDEYRTELAVNNHHVGVYAADTFDLLDALALNAAARLNWSAVQMQDGLGSELDGDHHYLRVNPSLGLSYQPWAELGVFASYGEANRVPTAAELGCADPDAPCRLPNAFVADPPLEQVVSRSVEFGLRGKLGDQRSRETLRWAVTGYGSRNVNDILFVAGSRVGTGYFRNAGTTQRAGMELDLQAELGAWELFTNYALLRATYQSTLELPGGAHPDATGAAAEGGVIQVAPGDRIPGLPLHSLRAGAGVRPHRRVYLGLSLHAQTAQYLRGDESNQLAPVDGFATLEAEARYEPLDGLLVFVQARNLLNAQYETFGVVADPSEVLPAYSTPRFLSPGAPLGVWGGVRVEGL